MSEISDTPRKIVFCITELDPGGAERALVQIVTRLDRSRWQPFVICLSGPGELVAALEQVGVSVICLGARHRWQVGILWRLARELRRIRPAILQTFLFHANLLGRLAGRLAGVRVVVSGIRVAERRSRWYLRLDRWTDVLVSRHVCVSQGVKAFSQQVAKLSPAKLVVIPNGVLASRFQQASPLPRQELDVTEADFLILFVGRLEEQKGLSDLLSAAEILQPDYPRLKWLLVGAGPLQSELSQRVQQAGLSAQFRFLGRRSDVPELMKTADLFVLPSLWEGMPNVILEAMAAQLPIVSTAVEGVDELLEAGCSAEIVPPQSPVALAAAIAKLVTNPPLRQEYARRASQRAMEKFSWEQVTAEYEALYEGLLKPR